MRRQIELKHSNLILSHVSIHYSVSTTIDTDESLCGIKNININSVLWCTMYNRLEKIHYDKYSTEVCKKCKDKLN